MKSSVYVIRNRLSLSGRSDMNDDVPIACMSLAVQAYFGEEQDLQHTIGVRCVVLKNIFLWSFASQC